MVFPEQNAVGVMRQVVCNFLKPEIVVVDLFIEPAAPEIIVSA